MSNFLKMFRSKKGGDKENDAPTEEESMAGGHRLSSRGSVRRDAKRYSSRFTDDTFLKPSAPYHTVTQPKQTKGSRSCVGVGRDEYDHFRFEQPFRERNGSRYNNKRLYSNASEFGRDTNLSSSININTYDPELGDSDDSYDSIRRSRTLKSDDTIKALEAKLESFAYRLRKEEDKKNAYKQKLMSERIIRQHVEAKFVEDIQRLTKLIDTLKNENKSYRNKINSLESQLKESKHMSRDLKLRNESAMNTHHFTTTNTPSSLFNSPPSTSNEQSSLNGAGEILCTASGSTLPIHSIVNPFNSTDDIDEVKNFRISEMRDMHSTLEIARCSTDSIMHQRALNKKSAKTQNADGNSIESTILEEDTSTTGTIESTLTITTDSGRRRRKNRNGKKSILRRSLSDSDTYTLQSIVNPTRMTTDL